MARMVRATRVGFFEGARRRIGDVFAIGDNTKLGKWMEEVKGATPKAAPLPPAKNAETTNALDAELAALKYNDLLARAKALGLGFEQNPKKEDLIAAIKDAEKGNPGSLV